MAVTGAYFDVPMGEVQKPGKVRDTFIGLSTESAALGKKLGIEFKEDIVTYNLKVIDKLAPESTASMQKDIARGHESEVQGLLFDMITAAEEQGIDVPTYREVAKNSSNNKEINMNNLLLSINWNPNPELFNLFGISIRYYGLLWAIGIFFAYIVVHYQYRDKKIDEKKFEPLFFYCFSAS